MLKFIGTGSAFNTKLGNNSAYIKEGNQLFLIDCGSANFHRMKESGLLDDVEHIHVYVTHTHADHVGSLADLIFYMFYCKGEFVPRVTVFAVHDIEVDEYLKFNGITNNHYNYHPVGENETYELEEFGIDFLPFSTLHVDEILSFGLIIDDYNKDEFIIYSGDSSELTQRINILFEKEGLDKLYVDTCSQDYDGNVHLSLKKLTEQIPLEYRHKVWCMHLDENFDVEYAKSLGFNVAEVEM